MEKTPNSSAPTLKLVNGPAGRDQRREVVYSFHAMITTFLPFSSICRHDFFFGSCTCAGTTMGPAEYSTLPTGLVNSMDID
jgi:hypothetical protein